ncbi:uncharacterized protein IL334_005747 [Kwoniella shivajii]|uniref:Glycosyl transferase CAP10 domain-containing protein n=1 Tax=Kwoniella shivajii TaxID=564305 RepID=A0ABZ1D3Z9_9TREE|nr:hypothetical protein IL334_005747 [Kwoniella shivajii]
MALVRYNLVIYILVSVLLLLGSYLEFTREPSIDRPRLSFLPSAYNLSPPDPSESENRHLSQDQCIERYPKLYHEADRAKAWYHARKGISKRMVDEAETDGGNARLVILNNKLFVKAFNGGINTRTQAVIAAVYATLLTSPEPLPDVDFVVQTSDAGSGDHPRFVLDRKSEETALWLMPDFGFFSWPEPGVGAYTEVRSKTLAYEHDLGLRLGDDMDVLHDSWENKTQQLFWRGVPQVEVRHELLRASENQPWSDVRALDWGAINQDEEGRKKNNGDLKSPAQHCQYAFLAHVEGWAYSGRLKYLQQCRSVIVTHEMEYIQHYHHLFVAQDGDDNQNMVEVQRPLEEHLPSVMEELLDPKNEEKVRRIADNNWKMIREGYISPAANDCYFRYALRAYASAQTFQPSLEDRSAPYESFLLMGTTHWDPHR